MHARGVLLIKYFDEAKTTNTNEWHLNFYHQFFRSKVTEKY